MPRFRADPRSGLLFSGPRKKPDVWLWHNSKPSFRLSSKAPGLRPGLRLRIQVEASEPVRVEASDAAARSQPALPGTADSDLTWRA